MTSVVRLVSATCPGSPWEEWRGHCYRLTHKKTPWHGVRGECKAFFRSADAASISSKAENDFIKSGFHDHLLLNEYLSSAAARGAWGHAPPPAALGHDGVFGPPLAVKIKEEEKYRKGNREKKR